MRCASDIKNHMGYLGVPEAVQSIEEQLDKKQYIKPSTKDLSYPQDSLPVQDLMPGADPTEAPLIRQQFMQSPQGGIAQMAPGMMDEYVDNQGLGPDTGLPYIVGTELQRQRRDSMNQLQQIPPSLLPPNLRGVW